MVLISRPSETAKAWDDIISSPSRVNRARNQAFTCARMLLSCDQQTSSCDNIKSGIVKRKQSQQREDGTVEGPVNRFIDAAVVQERFGLFKACMAA